MGRVCDVTEKVDFSLIEPELTKYIGTEGSLITVLQKTQDIYGYLSNDILMHISKRLNIKPAKVMGVVTFYTQFRTKPVGKYLILLCQGTACHVNKSNEIEEAVREYLKIEEGEISKDGLFTYNNVACLGCCSLSPVMMIGGKTYGNLTKDKAVKILKEIGKVDTVNHINPTFVIAFNDEWGYYGERKEGKKSGEGYELFQDGRKYVGHFEDNQPNGDGALHDKNGNIIAKGEWRDGLLIKGEGTLNFVDGRKYIGQYESNMPEGYGTLYDKNESILFKGTWRKGAFLKGEGTLTYQNKNKYIGQIENGIPNGNGTLSDSTGKIISKGQWKNGALLAN